ncbi:MAG: SET domain-containing protein-lysine N-methyltransferase [Acidobacteria bacterium]|nr:SET domain-containing protein-lysine N-methyltransferase [Acidobacteriota bacterium]
MEAVYVGNCDLGRGLFAGRNFEQSEGILRFRCPIISLAEVLARGKYQSNPIQVGNAEYVDIGPPGVFANHSCDPNAGIINNLDLIALRAIQQGEEIQYDYSTTMWEGFWTMSCLCNSLRCRKIVRDFPELPVELQTEYLRLGIVQSFIVQRLAISASVK